MAKKTSRIPLDPHHAKHQSSETIRGDRNERTISTNPGHSESQSVHWRVNCAFRILGEGRGQRLVFLRGLEPAPEISAALQAAFHRYFRGRSVGGRVKSLEFRESPSMAKRYLNHFDGLAKDYFSSETPDAPQPFGKYEFEFQSVTTQELDLLEAESIQRDPLLQSDSSELASDASMAWIREASESVVLTRAFKSLVELRQLVDQKGSPLAILKQVRQSLISLRSAVGKLLSDIYNRWAGMQWESFEESQAIASQMDAAAANLRLKFQIVDSSGESRIASLRCNRTGTNKKPGFQYESYEDGKHVIHRSSRFLLKTRLKPAPQDGRRSEV